MAIKAGAGFEPSVPTALFETRRFGLPAYLASRNQWHALTADYVATADGQRFLINQRVGGTPSSPITVVVNWPTLLKK